MGTRHLIQVDFNGEVKIAQYGQWDGYIDGQGYTILNFLRDKDNVKKLKEALDKVRFIDSENKDKEFIKDFKKQSENNLLSKEYQTWFNTFISRDIGAGILSNVILSNNKEIILKNSVNFKDDDLFCEFFYIINLDDMTLNINNFKTYDINNLPSNKDVKADFEG